MAKFKVIVSDPEAGTSKVVELEEARAAPLIGRRIGEVIDGSIVDLPGHKAQIRGGSDKDGFPMRPSVHGGVRRRIVLSGGVGFNPLNEGSRRRKTVRGNVITDEIVQINMKITEKPKQTKETKKTKEKKEEKPALQKEAQTTKTASTQQQPDTTQKT
jgi:small subunit ribosomal protein S6e